MALCLAILFLSAASWPLTGLCAGRPLGRDCESWFIVGANLLGPFGWMALLCWAWSARTASWTPQACRVIALVATLSALAALV